MFGGMVDGGAEDASALYMAHSCRPSLDSCRYLVYTHARLKRFREVGR